MANLRLELEWVLGWGWGMGDTHLHLGWVGAGIGWVLDLKGLLPALEPLWLGCQGYSGGRERRGCGGTPKSGSGSSGLGTGGSATSCPTQETGWLRAVGEGEERETVSVDHASLLTWGSEVDVKSGRTLQLL